METVTHFEAMWTRHKTQKRKVWNDGRLAHQHRSGQDKLVLYDDQQKLVASCYLSRANPVVVAPGEVITFEQHLAEIIGLTTPPADAPPASSSSSEPEPAAEPTPPAKRPPSLASRSVAAKQARSLRADAAPTVSKFEQQFCQTSSLSGVDQQLFELFGCADDNQAADQAVQPAPARAATGFRRPARLAPASTGRAAFVSPLKVHTTSSVESRSSSIESSRSIESTSSNSSTRSIESNSSIESTRSIESRSSSVESTSRFELSSRSSEPSLRARDRGAFVSPVKAPAWTVERIVFSSSQVAALMKDRHRTHAVVRIPAQFDSAAAYQRVLSRALIESINLQLLEQCSQFWSVVEALPGFPSAKHAQLLRDKGVSCFVNCQLHSNAKTGQRATTTPRYFLELDSTRPASKFSKGDVYALCGDPTFARGPVHLAQSVWHGPSREQRLEVAAVDGHEIASLVGRKQLVALGLGSAVQHDIQTLAELQLLTSARAPPVLPALLRYTPSLATTELRTPLSGEAYAAAQARVAERLSLNEHQRAVLAAFAGWMAPADGPASNACPVLLVRGVFGSGKSVLLVALLLLLREVSTGDGPVARVLVSAQCNVAVDRILLELVEHDFHAFCRVGSVRKIAKPLLKYTLYRDDRDARDSSEALTAMLLHERLSADEAALVRAELDVIKAGLHGRRRERLASAFVVGVTAISACNGLLDGCTFPLVFIDEASQIVEPLSLLPLLRFDCARLVLVGDPAQLPPTLPAYPRSSDTPVQLPRSGDTPIQLPAYPRSCDAPIQLPAHSCSSDTPVQLPAYPRSCDTPVQLPAYPRSSEEKDGLRQTLFSRLVRLGYTPLWLRTTFRCHPSIADIPNQLFYGGQLLHGVTPAMRPPLVAGLPPVVFVHYSAQGSEQIARGGSIVNAYEQNLIVTILRRLLADPAAAAWRLGCIFFYAAFADRLRADLAQQLPPHAAANVQISTVDAFQGGEQDIVILACARTHGIGFIDDPHRLNVALSRARNHLIIVGCDRALESNPLWADVIRRIKADPAGEGRSFISADHFIASKSFLSL